MDGSVRTVTGVGKLSILSKPIKQLQLTAAAKATADETIKHREGGTIIWESILRIYHGS